MNGIMKTKKFFTLFEDEARKQKSTDLTYEMSDSFGFSVTRLSFVLFILRLSLLYSLYITFVRYLD